MLATQAAHAIGGEGTAREATADSAKTEAGVETEEGVSRTRVERLYLGLDFTLGFGDYVNVQSQLGISGQLYPSYVFANSQIRTTTFTLLGHYRLDKFGIGARLPLISSHIADAGANEHGGDLFTNGALELSLDMPRRLSPQVRYIPEIALDLPLAPGNTPPNTQAELTAATSPQTTPDQAIAAQSLQNGYQRYISGIAAAFARGGEDDALYFNWRIGIVPKVGFDMKFNHTKIQPYVKIPVMIAIEQTPAAEEPVRVEAVAGVRFAQEIGPIQLGLRVVGMVPIASRWGGAEGQVQLKDPMLSVWPEIRVQFTPSAKFWVSGMIPLAGDFNVFDDGKNGSFEAGIGATF